MSLEKFLKIIDGSFVGRFIADKTSALDQINPERFYVENVRRFFGLPSNVAKQLCELAVKMGYFNKKISVECPTCKRIILSANQAKNLPDEVKCEICEMNEEDEFEFRTSNCKQIEYYQLKKK